MTRSHLQFRVPMLSAALSLLLSGIGFAASNNNEITNPDFTKGDTLPEGWSHDWNLGPTGLRGWMHSHQQATSLARQIYITEVASGSPADGQLRIGDAILGVGGEPFAYDPRTEFGKAITNAESEAGGGKLSLILWRDGETQSIDLRLPVLGSYGTTAPWDCQKSQQILALGFPALAQQISDSSDRTPPITRSLNALALLASGEDQYLPLIKKEAEWAAQFTTDGFKTWHYGYIVIFLSEYLMATGDDSVLPGLRRLTMEAAEGQSAVGSWGHRFAGDDDRLMGYGMMNSPGIPLTIGLVLALEAGIEDPKVSEAIEKSARLIRFYAGKGSIPYGDHRPWIQTHDDNGKNGMAAVLFSLLGETEKAEYFSRMSIASHSSERDSGHTGNFFNMIWAMPGVTQSGPHAAGAWMEEFGGWYFDLARRWDGTFIHQGPPSLKKDSYQEWDCSGAYLLAYAIPNGTLHLSSKKARPIPSIDRTTAQNLIADGRGWSRMHRDQLYDDLTQEELLTRLASWSPVVRERAGVALGKHEDVVPALIQLLEAPDFYTRYGACQALKMQTKGRGAPAVGALRRTFSADDLWLRILAAEALAGIGTPAKEAVPELLHRLTQSDPENDPRNMEQRYLSLALFNQRDGLIGRSLEGVDRELLFKAVRAGLQNEDGRARGSYASVYQNLSFNEISPLLPSIHEAISIPSPSGIMFADGIRTSGLELFAKHHISEGIELLADYARSQKKHGSQKRILVILDLLKSYGAHAKRAIPHLEESALYFENEEQDFPRNLSLEKAKFVREAIREIKAAEETPELKSLNLE